MDYPEIKTPNWDCYYLNIAKEVARKSKCYRAMSGAVIVRYDRVISTGYIGAPRKTKDCLERGNCLRSELNIPRGQRYELCRSVHAEQNAIINAARAGVSLSEGDMYIYGERVEKDGTRKPMDMVPCSFCKRMIINSGLEKIICSKKDGGVNIFHVEDWIKDWQISDIIDDTSQYGQGLKVYKTGEDPIMNNSNNKKIIIGITGTYSSGKDTVSEYLKQKGFSHYSCSDILREEADKMGLEQNRDNWIKIGNDLRQQFGPGILGQRILEKIDNENVTKAVVSSIRNPGEIDELKNTGSFYLIKVDAPIEIRYERAKRRGNLADDVSFEKFKFQEQSELVSDDPAKQQISACMQMADYTILNSGSMEELYKKIDEILGKIQQI